MNETSAIADDNAERASTLSTSGAIVLLLGGMLGNFVFGASTIALPEIAARLHLDAGTAGLVVSLFALGFASSLVFGGRLGDRVGRRMLFRLGLVALAATSLAAAAAPGGFALLVARVLQGVAAGLMLPQVLSTIQHAATGVDRARWLAGYAFAVAAGATAGLLVAGALASFSPEGWRALFVVIAAISILVVVCTRSVPVTRSAHTAGLDPVGSVLFAIGIATILLPLSLGPQHGWPWWTIALFGVSAATLIAFALWERRIDESRALVPAAALREPVLLAGLAMTTIFFSGYGAFFYLFSLSAENGMGFSALGAAVALVPFAVGFLIAATLAPRLAAVWRPVARMRFGAAVQVAMLVLIAIILLVQWPTPNEALLQPALFVFGAAQAVMFTPLISTVMSSVSHHIAGLASGLFMTAQQLATALSVAVLGALYTALGSGGVAFASCLFVDAALGVLFFALAGRTQSGSSTASTASTASALEPR
ncbi:MFS transporter [Gryllotalpicola daejeonensis]|uniref:MFS transporter n=1 Tax=Gryllotalpicola daejeonensis TaxID=993087 RepID=A0ABP7ZE03_9MICO